MHTTARLSLEKLAIGHTTRTHLVVSLRAPPVEARSRRPRVCVIPVIDVSGSMQGAKLDQARKSVMKLIDHLGPEDWCGVAAFASQVYLVAAPEPMSPEAKARLKLAVGDLEAVDQTNLAGGMLRGLELAKGDGVPQDALARVILFTDGHANHGIATEPAALLELLDAHRGRSTLSAFGYGADADQDLLADLARRGDGNYAFVAGPDEAMSAFARELGGLLSTYSRDIVVSVNPSGGARVVSVLSDVDADTRRGVTRIELEDILGEEERHLVLEVELPGPDAPGRGEPFAVEGRYALASDGDGGTVQRFEHRVSVEWVAPREAQRHPNHELDVIVAQAQLLRAQLDAEEAARQGDFGRAVHVLLLVGDDLDRRGHQAAADTCRAMADKVRDGRAFRGSSAYRKSMHAGLRRGSSSALESEAFGDLRAMGKVVRTREQERMAGSFEEGKDQEGTGSTQRTSGGARQRRSRRW